MTTLANALQSCDMLLIDGLHCFDFVHDDSGLRAECMDGRTLKRWIFTPEQIAASLVEGQDWLIAGETGQHRLACMSAFRAPEDDGDNYNDEAAGPTDDR